MGKHAKTLGWVLLVWGAFNFLEAQDLFTWNNDTIDKLFQFGTVPGVLGAAAGAYLVWR